MKNRASYSSNIDETHRKTSCLEESHSVPSFDVQNGRNSSLGEHCKTNLGATDDRENAVCKTSRHATPFTINYNNYISGGGNDSLGLLCENCSFEEREKHAFHENRR
eukprot:Awhi_evm1s3763